MIAGYALLTLFATVALALRRHDRRAEEAVDEAEDARFWASLREDDQSSPAK